MLSREKVLVVELSKGHTRHADAYAHSHLEPHQSHHQCETTQHPEVKRIAWFRTVRDADCGTTRNTSRSKGASGEFGLQSEGRFERSKNAERRGGEGVRTSADSVNLAARSKNLVCGWSCVAGVVDLLLLRPDSPARTS